MIESIFFNPWIWIVPIIIGLLFILLVVGIILFITHDSDGWIMGSAMSGLCLLILGPIYFGMILPPYDASYYHTYRITGEVVNIEQAFNSEDGGVMSQVFVAEVDGVDLLIRSDDQRFRTITEGDDIQLACTKQFKYFVTPWYECSFGG